MTKDEIRQRREALDAAAMKLRKALGRQIAADQAGHRKALYQACQLGGHTWVFQHFGPLGNPWYLCTCCHLKKARENDS